MPRPIRPDTRPKRTPRPPPRRADSGPQAALDHIREVSQNARANWFSLLALLTFVGVALMGHQDRDFFAVGVQTQLPLVGISVPPTAFFLAAPVLTAVLYAYLHLYLLNLWDALGDAPPRIAGNPLSEHIFPTLLAHAALWWRAHCRGDGAAPPRALGPYMALASVLLAWGFGIVILALLWWQSTALHHEGLTLWTALWLAVAAAAGYGSFTVMHRRMARNGHAAAHAPWSPRVRRTALALTAGLALASWLATEGLEGAVRHVAAWTSAAPATAPEDWRVRDAEGWHSRRPLYERLAALARQTLAAADLSEAKLTPRPDGWKPWPLWRDDFEADYRKLRDLKPDDALETAPGSTFWTEMMRRYRHSLSALDGAAMSAADLRGVNMVSAFLPGADLRAARLRGAVLRGAQTQGAFLRGAEMQGADLSFAQMQGAVLRGAQMQGADMRTAHLQGAILLEAQMQGAVLGYAEMQGTLLALAQMQGTNLVGAQMQGAVLGRAQMQGANLVGAQMQGADLRWAQMQGANLQEAQMQGADLREAWIQDADCSSATLTGALLQSATLTCRNLTQEQLDQAVGDSETVLPPGLTVASCLASLPKDVEEALAAHRSEKGGPPFHSSRAEIRAALLCPDGVKPHATGSWPFERRYWDRYR